MEYAVNQEGVDALRSMSRRTDEAIESLYKLTSELQGFAGNYEDTLGPHKASLNGALRGVYIAIKEGAAPAEEVSGILREIAGDYEEIIASDPFGGAGTSGVASGVSSGSAGSNSSSGNNGSNGKNGVTEQSIDQIQGWISDINPNYDEFMPPDYEYNSNCGSCAFAVENRLNGNNDSVATIDHSLRTDSGMEAATGKKCIYMSPKSIEKKLQELGPGSHLIVGINRRPTIFGKPRAGHWFNVYYDGNKIYTIDGQCGKVFDWPHDYGSISAWCALV